MMMYRRGPTCIVLGWDKQRLSHFLPVPTRSKQDAQWRCAVPRSWDHKPKLPKKDIVLVTASGTLKDVQLYQAVPQPTLPLEP